MPRKRPPDAPPKKPHANDAEAQLRTDEIVRLRLDGAEMWDIRKFAKEMGWGIGDTQLYRYIHRADDLIRATLEKDREKLIADHSARRRALYARAIKAGELRTALDCLKDDAALCDLYPDVKVKAEVAGKAGAPIEHKHDIHVDLGPYAAAIAAYATSQIGGALPQDDPSQRLDTAQAPPQAGVVPASRG